MKPLLPVLSMFAVSMLSTTARAADATEPNEGRLGQPGHLMLGFHGSMQSDGNRAGPGFRVSSAHITPALDVLVARNLTLGFAATTALDYSTAGDSDSVFLTVTPQARVGYIIPLGKYAALWPIARAGYGFGWVLDADPVKYQTFVVGVDPQLVVMLGRTVYVLANGGGLQWSTGVTEASPIVTGFQRHFGIGVGGVL